MRPTFYEQTRNSSPQSRLFSVRSKVAAKRRLKSATDQHGREATSVLHLEGHRLATIQASARSKISEEVTIEKHLKSAQ
jgi:hypothetical protein